MVIVFTGVVTLVVVCPSCEFAVGRWCKELFVF